MGLKVPKNKDFKWLNCVCKSVTNKLVMRKEKVVNEYQPEKNEYNPE